MKRPSFQFYPADWRNNAKLRRCTEAARGVWIDVLCVMHDSDEYGVLRWPIVEISRGLGVPIKCLRELAERGVLKGGDRDVPSYVFTPRHENRDGDPVTLIPATTGPCWYSSRFVRDEYVRRRRGGEGKFTAEKQPDNRSPKAAPMPPIGSAPIPPLLHGASSASASSSSKFKSEGAFALNGHESETVKKGRATRLPADWKLPDKWREWAVAAHNLDSERVVRISLKFRDHFLSAPGQKGVKANWEAAFRNWIRREIGDD